MITFNEWLSRIDEVLAQSGIGVGIYKYPDDGNYGLIIVPEGGGPQKITSPIVGIKALNLQDSDNNLGKYYEVKTSNNTYVIVMKDDVARNVMTTFYGNRGN